LIFQLASRRFPEESKDVGHPEISATQLDSFSRLVRNPGFEVLQKWKQRLQYQNFGFLELKRMKGMRIKWRQVSWGKVE